MNCKAARKWMSPYLDSELERNVSFEVGEHLADCPDCQTRFSCERSVDDMVRSRLRREAMPRESWSRIRTLLLLPIRRHRLRRILGVVVAATLLLAFVNAFRLPPSEAQRPWIVRHYLESVPRNAGFSQSPRQRAAAFALLRETLGIELADGRMETRSGTHTVELVSAALREDANGAAYVEVRLNCCGEPVLMVLSAGVGRAVPTVIMDESPGVTTRSRWMDDVNVVSGEIGGVFATVVSRHPVEQILDSLLTNT